MKEIIYWDDIGYAAEVERREYRVDFVVKAIVGWGGNGHTDPSYRIFPTPLVAGSHETTEVFADAAVFYEGCTKYDGCTSVTFPEQDHCSLHFCGFGNFENFLELNRRLFSLIGNIEDMM